MASWPSIDLFLYSGVLSCTHDRKFPGGPKRLKSGASQKRRPVHLAGGKFQLELSGTNRRFKEKSSAHFWWQAIPTTVARGSTVSPHPVKDRKTKSTTGAASGEHTGSGMLTMSSFYHGHPRDYKVLVGGHQCCHVHPLSLS